MTTQAEAITSPTQMPQEAITPEAAKPAPSLTENFPSMVTTTEAQVTSMIGKTARPETATPGIEAPTQPVAVTPSVTPEGTKPGFAAYLTPTEQNQLDQAKKIDQRGPDISRAFSGSQEDETMRKFLNETVQRLANNEHPIASTTTAAAPVEAAPQPMVKLPENPVMPPTPPAMEATPMAPPVPAIEAAPTTASMPAIEIPTPITPDKPTETTLPTTAAPVEAAQPVSAPAEVVTSSPPTMEQPSVASVSVETQANPQEAEIQKVVTDFEGFYTEAMAFVQKVQSQSTNEKMSKENTDTLATLQARLNELKPKVATLEDQKLQLADQDLAKRLRDASANVGAITKTLEYLIPKRNVLDQVLSFFK